MKKIVLTFLMLITTAAVRGAITSDNIMTYIAIDNGIQTDTTTLYNQCVKAKAMGAGWVRANTDAWDAIQPTQTSWSFGTLDQFVATVTGTATGQGNMKLLFTLPWSATWNRIPGGPFTSPYGAVPITHAPATSTAPYMVFGATMAARYGGPSVAFEGHNEADHPLGNYNPANNGLCPSATFYAYALSAWNSGIKSACPGCTFTNGGLAFPESRQLASCTTFYTTSGHTFWDQVMATTAPVDAVSFHFYPDTGDTMALDVSTLTVQMTNRGQVKPLWCTETAPFGSSTYPNNAAFDEDRKTSYAYRVFAESLGVYGLAKLSWHSLIECSGGAGCKFAAMDINLNPHPCYTAIQTMYNQLNGAVFVSSATVSGGTVQHFLNGKRTVDFYFTDSGSSSLAVPFYYHRAKKINRDGTTTFILPNDFNSLTISTVPFSVQQTSSPAVQQGYR